MSGVIGNTGCCHKFIIWWENLLTVTSLSLLSLLHIYSFTLPPKNMHMDGYFSLWPKLYLCIFVDASLWMGAEVHMVLRLCEWLSPREPHWFSPPERGLYSVLRVFTLHLDVWVLWFESLRLSVSTEQAGNVITQKCSHEVLRWPGTKVMDWEWWHCYYCGNAWPSALHVPSLKGAEVFHLTLQAFKLHSELWILSFHEMAYLFSMSVLQQTLIVLPASALLNWQWCWIESVKAMQKWKVHE